MNKIKRGVSLLLCSLLFGSAVTLGNVADVQAGKQIKTETKQTINNTKYLLFEFPMGNIIRKQRRKFPTIRHQVRQGGMRKIKQGKERRLILLNQK